MKEVVKEIVKIGKILAVPILALSVLALKDTQVTLTLTNVAIFCGLPLLTLLVGGGIMVATNLKK